MWIRNLNSALHICYQGTRCSDLRNVYSFVSFDNGSVGVNLLTGNRYTVLYIKSTFEIGLTLLDVRGKSSMP